MDIISVIKNVNPERHHGNLNRRLLKLMEEFGEVSEAYLSVTSENNYKKKTWRDVREELSDLVFVAVDCWLTDLPRDEDDADYDLDYADESQEREDILQSKIDKYRKIRELENILAQQRISEKEKENMSKKVENIKSFIHQYGDEQAKKNVENFSLPEPRTTTSAEDHYTPKFNIESLLKKVKEINLRREQARNTEENVSEETYTLDALSRLRGGRPPVEYDYATDVYEGENDLNRGLQYRVAQHGWEEQFTTTSPSQKCIFQERFTVSYRREK